jgi:Co/Zn/Cd efflux system component
MSHVHCDDHAHGHSHHHPAPGASNRAFALGIALNVGFVVVELVYGWLSGSLALLADAGHNLSDVAGLVLAWGAALAGGLRPTHRRTYGWMRASILAALANALLLIFAMGVLAVEAVQRLQAPEPVEGWTVIVIAAIGVLVNGLTAMLFVAGRKSDLNVRGAFLHMAGDALVSLGVVVAGLLYLQLGWGWLDPLVSLVIAVVSTLAILNLLRSPTGRAFVAIRDSEISAQSMGIHLARYKTLSFSISAALAGIGGALYAHKLQFISPDQFNILQSIDLLLMIVIGGLGSVHGAFLGAIFLISMPQAIAMVKDYLPAAIGQAPGLQAAVYGLVLIAFVLFEPMGLYGRWLKVRTWLQMFPFYRKGLFKRQKSFQKSDRLK